MRRWVNMPRHRFHKALVFCTLALAGCGVSGPEGEPATKMAVSLSSAFTWRNLCKRVTLSFTDDNGVAHRWGRDEALALTVTNAAPYATSDCNANPINSLYLGPENNQAIFWIRAVTYGTITVTISGSLNGEVTLTSEQAKAKVVLGQADFDSGNANRGGSANSNTLFAPNGVTTCGSKLFIADASNNRVLGWNSIPTTNGQAADFVLGEPNLTTATGGTARGGTGSPSMKGPSGVACTSDTLYVADATNSRILGFTPIPNSSNPAATFVWGAAGDFNSAGAPSSNPATQSSDDPTTLALFGASLVAINPFWHRVLIWNTAPSAVGGAATGIPDYVIGQPDFTTKAAGTATNKLDSPAGGRLRDGYLIVSDFNNNRVLLFSTPVSSGASPVRSLGRADLATGYAGGELNKPSVADYDGDHLIVADTGNARILIWNGFPQVDGEPADLALGAPSDFSLPGSGQAHVHEGVYAQFWIGGGYLWVSDYNRHRVVAFPAP